VVGMVLTEYDKFKKCDKALLSSQNKPMYKKKPKWSVMIPTYNCAEFLKQTLISVLMQDLGPDQMQIEVVDDYSTQDDPEAVVNEVGKGRIYFYRKPKNKGATENFNTCISRARGELIHILHGDDFVLPAFYESADKAFERYPEISAFFSRCNVINRHNKKMGLSGVVPHLLKPNNDPGEVLYKNHFLTPGVVIKRSFYEKEGGFREDLVHVADWEMWVRVISNGSAIWSDQILSSYREFEANETSRLAKNADNLRNCLLLGETIFINKKSFSMGKFSKEILRRTKEQIRFFLENGDMPSVAANSAFYQELTSEWSTMRHLQELLINK